MSMLLDLVVSYGPYAGCSGFFFWLGWKFLDKSDDSKKGYYEVIQTIKLKLTYKYYKSFSLNEIRSTLQEILNLVTNEEIQQYVINEDIKDTFRELNRHLEDMYKLDELYKAYKNTLNYAAYSSFLLAVILFINIIFLYLYPNLNIINSFLNPISISIFIFICVFGIKYLSLRKKIDNAGEANS